MAEHLATIVSCHPDRGDLRCPLVHVEIRGMGDVHTSVGEVHRALRITRKAREKLFPYRYHLVGLAAPGGHFPRYENVLTVAEHPPKGVTGKRSTARLLPFHDHPGILPPRQGHSDPFPTIEVAREVSGEDLPDFLVIGFRLQGTLVLPFLRKEVGRFPL